MSEDAACNRIEAARACRRFPLILDRLACGSLSLTSVRLLARHLTPENHQAVLARACGRSRREIEALFAELAPRPDVPTSVRRLPNPTRVPTLDDPKPAVMSHSPAAPPQPEAARTPPVPASAARVAPPRPVVQASAPARYRVQFTIGEDTHAKLRRLQALLRREIPDGDPAAIVERALSLLLEQVEQTKLGATKLAPAAKPSPAIRPGTDSSASRHVPREVRREVWRRDDGRCGFVSATGLRCTERTFLEWHHKKPYAQQGPATPENIALRCRRHNQYEAELVFGPSRASSAAIPWTG